MLTIRSLTITATVILAVSLLMSPADARIRCDGPYQVHPDGTEISSPYCVDRYLYEVARNSYSISTSFSAIRNSIFEKERICRMIGHDYRVNDICLEFLPSGDDRWSR
jgi:hypothetical protein